MNNYFAYNLKKIRKENNLSQEQLADELGVSRQAVSKWESGTAYPEMNKIIALCDKFNLNMDDLLSKDIKEVKGEKKSKKKLNSYFYDFLNFITDAINLFSNMNFKSKVKFVFEEISVIIILTLISSVSLRFIERLITPRLFAFYSNEFTHYTCAVFNGVALIFFIIFSIVVFYKIFKLRYLNSDQKHMSFKVVIKFVLWQIIIATVLVLIFSTCYWFVERCVFPFKLYTECINDIGFVINSVFRVLVLISFLIISITVFLQNFKIKYSKYFSKAKVKD